MNIIFYCSSSFVMLGRSIIKLQFLFLLQSDSVGVVNKTFADTETINYPSFGRLG